MQLKFSSMQRKCTGKEFNIFTYRSGIENFKKYSITEGE